MTHTRVKICGITRPEDARIAVENVASAIERVRPAAVDVSGGVELEPGIKSAAGIREFIAAVRTADQRLDGQSHE